MKQRALALVGLAVLGMLAAPSAAHAQTYDVPWWTVDGGGVQGSGGGSYVVSGTTGQPDAGGPYVGGSYVVSSGFWAYAAGAGGGPQADLSITKTDGQTTAVPGQPLTYTIVATNAGPDPASGAPVTDSLPSSLIGASWTCVGAGGGACSASGSGSISDSITLPVGATATYTLTATIDPAAVGSVANTASVTPPSGVIDPNPADNSATDTDTLVAPAVPPGELVHGTSLWADLRSVAGVADEDLFRIGQKPYSSYEVLVDGTSADIGTGLGPELDRLASDGTTVLQASVAAGAGASRSLRWENDTAGAVNDQYVRVRSAGCTTDCGPEDVYRIRAWDTTLRVPRFNNSGTQITVLVLQNTSEATVSGHVQFWDGAGALLGEEAFTLGSRAAFVVNTSTIPGLAGVGGTITLSHDGSYGVLKGKAVAVEPATGFTFDTEMMPRPR